MMLLLTVAAGAAGVAIRRTRKKRRKQQHEGVMKSGAPAQNPYEPLRASQIRLLRLEPQTVQYAGDNQYISGELIVADLGSSSLPKFTTLSYAWGSDDRPRQVHISGYAVDITENLFAVLRDVTRARLSNTTTALSSLMSNPCAALMWIDAICINQNDKVEKASQVRMMARIYGSSTLTIMSLGDATSQSRLALDWCINIAGIHETRFLSMTDDEKVNRLFNEPAWNGLCDLILRPYFRRRWIIEEAALSPDPWIICGEQGMNWKTFFTAYDRICGVLFNLMHQRHYVLRTTDIEAIAGIGMLRERLYRGTPVTLFEALVRFRRCNTVKARDRVFSLLGLCSVAEARHIRINYSDDMQLEDIFKQQVVAHIVTWHNSDILCICQERVRIERRKYRYQLPNGLNIAPDPPDWAVAVHLPNLPTWAPNWSSPRGEWFLGPENRAAGSQWCHIFNAAKNTLPEVIGLLEAPASNQLRVRGIEIDSVIAIEETTPPPDPTQKNPCSNFYKYCWQLSRQLPLEATPYRSESERMDAFWRTLTLGGRKNGTNELYSMAYIRYFCHEFFQGPGVNSHFGELLSNAGFRRCDRPPRHVWFTNPNIDPFFFRSDQDTISFDKLAGTFRFFVTSSGRMGMGPAHTSIGDKVCIIYGCSSPILLNASTLYINGLCVRGEAYVDGFMWGEGVDMRRQEIVRDQLFTLV